MGHAQGSFPKSAKRSAYAGNAAIACRTAGASCRCKYKCVVMGFRLPERGEQNAMRHCGPAAAGAGGKLCVPEPAPAFRKTPVFRSSHPFRRLLDAHSMRLAERLPHTQKGLSSRRSGCSGLPRRNPVARLGSGPAEPYDGRCFSRHKYTKISPTLTHLGIVPSTFSHFCHFAPLSVWVSIKNSGCSMLNG